MRKSLIAIFALFLLCAFSAPVMADSHEGPMWKFYGSARMATWYSNVTDGASSLYGDNTIVSTGDESDAGTIWALQGNSRVGATVKGETIGGGFEYGTGINLRKLFGTYTMGDSEFLVGQTYTPLAYRFYSNQAFGVDDGLLSVGNVYTGRAPMLQWKYQGFRIALVKPVVDDLGLDAADADSVIPKVEARYVYNADNWFVDVFGGGNWYDIETPEKDRTLSAYIFGLGLGFDSGAFYAKAMGWLSRNADQMGQLNAGDASAGVKPPVGGSAGNLNDNDGFAGMIALGFKATDTMAFEAGYGYTRYELDQQTGINDRDDTQAIYVNAIIDIVPGFFVVPEVGYYDYMDDFDGDGGSETYFGAKWQINF